MWPTLAVPAAQLRFSILGRLLASLVVSGAVLTGQPNGQVEITAMRQAVIQGTPRIAIEFSGEFEYLSNRLHAPERVYLEFPKTKLRTELRSSYSQKFADETVSRVRVAATAGMTRVVLDMLEPVEASTTTGKNPARLIELRLTSRPTPQTRMSVPPPDDHVPRPAQGQGSTPPLKPMSLELTSETEPAPVQAQHGLSRRHALRLSPTSATPGGFAAVRLELDSPAGQEPQALQWEFSYPSPKLGIEDGDLVAGSVATAAGKSLVCAGRVESAAVYVYRCILAGGVKLVPNGAIAEINFRVRSHAKLGPATVRISNALAVTMDGKEAPIQPNEADITIR